MAWRVRRHVSDIAALLVRAVRQKQGRAPEPSTAILDSQSLVSGPQAGSRGVDGNKKMRGIKRHVLTCSLGVARTALRRYGAGRPGDSGQRARHAAGGRAPGPRGRDS